jgi:Dolichyl-phosphate-mannose-protein mannosyltransferase
MISISIPQQKVRHRYWLTSILVLALALRVIYGLSQDHAEPYGNTGGDSTWYLANGYALATGFERGNLEGYGAGQYPISLQNLPTPPLYLLMIGSAQRIFAHETAIIAIRLMQAIMSAATCYFAYRLAATIANDEGAGLITANVLAISPAFVMESAQIATETLYIFLVAGGLWLYVRHNCISLEQCDSLTPPPNPLPASQREGQPQFQVPLHAMGRDLGRGYMIQNIGRLIFVGIILGLATLTRAVLLLFPLGLALHLLMVYGLRKGLRQALILLIVYALTVSTWTVYNLLRWDRWVIAGEGFAAFLYIGASDAGWQGPAAVDQSLGENLPDDPADQQERYTEGAQQIISRDPLGYVRRRVSELVEAYLQPHGTLFFSGESLRELALGWLRDDRSISGLFEITRGEAFWPKLSLYIFHYVGFIAGLIGMWLSRRQWRVTLPLIGFIAYTTLIHLVLTALPRYLFPNDVFWWIFAGVALWSAMKNIRISTTAAPSNQPLQHP